MCLRAVCSVPQVARALQGGTITAAYVRGCGLPADLEGRSCADTLAMVDDAIRCLTPPLCS